MKTKWAADNQYWASNRLVEVYKLTYVTPAAWQMICTSSAVVGHNLRSQSTRVLLVQVSQLLSNIVVMYLMGRILIETPWQADSLGDDILWLLCRCCVRLWAVHIKYWGTYLAWGPQPCCLRAVHSVRLVCPLIMCLEHLHWWVHNSYPHPCENP